MKIRAALGLLLVLVASVSAWEAAAHAQAPTVGRQSFGTTTAGEAVDLFTLRNSGGMEARVTNYGAIIVSLRVPDRNGALDDVALGFDSLPPYLGSHPFFGALVGRYANRIANATFTIDGETFSLTANSGPNHIHGGRRGFDKIAWRAEPFQTDTSSGLVFTYTSPHGEEGYPGTLRNTVTYTLTDSNQLIFDYHATTDRPTHVNFTQHSYFNLAGQGRGDIMGHQLTLNASRFTVPGPGLIPTGEIAAVAGTPLDFRRPAPIGARIDQDHEQMRLTRGYDHNFVLDREADGLMLAARVHEPVSGRVLEVYTTEPGIQLYTANFREPGVQGKGGAVYLGRGGFALETQHFPDSPNQPAFPSTLLRPGEEYRSRTVYRFSVQP
jgi:aldose 1-epimerase